MKYVKPQLNYDAKQLRQDELRVQQLDFCKFLTLQLMIEKDLEFIYVDETTFNLWQTPSRVWIKDGMHIAIPKDRGVSITLISSLSVERGIIHSEVFSRSNTKETFKRFISNLKTKCEDRRCVVIMDNLSVHNAKIVN